MKIKYLVTNIILFYLIAFSAISDEVKFDSSQIELKENGNLIISYNSKTSIPAKNIEIISNKATYLKLKNILTLEGNVIYKDLNKDIAIKSEKIIYEKEKDLLYSDGFTKIFLDNKYQIESEHIFYDRIQELIYGNDDTIINDSENNLYKLKESYEFDIVNEIIKSKKSIIIDNSNNKYIFENLAINLKSNEIAGKEVKVEFEDSYFGNDENDPLLKGRSAISNDKELRVYKAVFSTCNIDKKKCRGWELNSDEFNHDKERKLFEYKNAWLKLFDIKLFYVPYFNHPDPTVKRKSGFLTPSYSVSESLGTAINLPYYKVLGKDRDITFNPRYYADESFLLQNEYRQVLKNSKILNDFSFLVGEAGTKSHFFYNQLGKINNNLNFELNLQDVRGDNYLKNHKLIETSELISNDNILLSNLDLNWDLKEASLNTSFKIFEDLSRTQSDRYQYVLPEFSYSKNIEIPEDYNGNFNFSSSGYNTHYNTNVYETNLTNNFLFSSNRLLNSNGLVSNYNLLLKNANSYTNNSSDLKEDSNYDLFGTFKIDTSLPLQKKMKDFTHFLKPIASFRYSPNKNRDISSKDILLSYNNVFSLDRIGSSDQVEGGESLSLGLEFKRDNNDGFKIIDFKVANVLRLKENNKLPIKSKLNKTRSDIFGSLRYNFNDNLNAEYFFSYDRDLEYSNLEQFALEYEVNNFLTNFSYYTEDNDFGSQENLKNNTSFNFNKENKISFEMTKDLANDFTQYYDVMYTYYTDCISINFNYNKSFFSDGNLKPNKTLSFLIKIIPFTELGVPNVGTLIRQ